MKLLGIDWGKSKIGIAISDKRWNIVTPHDVINFDNSTYNKIISIIDNYDIKRVVIGLPLSIHENRIRKEWEGFNFFENLKRKIDIEVSWCNERYSSDRAFEKLSKAKMKFSRKRKKIDKTAACIILERFIDKKTRNKNVTVAISGNIGTGKTFIAEKLQKITDAKIIDMDKISRKLTKKNNIGYKKVIKAFGRNILDNDGDIDRSKLGEIVFNEQDKLERLNSILHPLIIEETLEKINSCSNRVVIIEVPLLVENKLYYLYDYSLLTKASKDVIISRVRNRDQVKSDYVQKIMNKQDTSKTKDKLFDYIVSTDNGWSPIKDKVNHIGNHVINFKKFLNRR